MTRWTIALLGGALISVGALVLSLCFEGSSADRSTASAIAATWPAVPKTSAAAASGRLSGNAAVDLDASHARRLLSRAFPEFVEGKGWLDLKDQPGVRLRRYIDDQSAVVDLGGRRAVVRSLMPLRAGVGKDKRALDTGLIRHGKRLRPRQGLSSYSLGASTTSGSALAFTASKVRVSLQGARPSAGVRHGRVLAFPNAYRDSDAVLKPMPDGAQVAYTIRGPRAPESFALALSLQAGDRLAATAPNAKGVLRGPVGGAVVLRDDRPVTTITAPSVIDARGGSVEVTTKIADRGIEYHVPHRSKPVAYPALLDPFVAEDQRYWFGPAGGIPPSANTVQDFAGWSFTSNSSDIGGFAGSGGFGRGLNIFSATNRIYPADVAAFWTFQAPYHPSFEADGARIIKADFGYTAHKRAVLFGSANGSYMAQAIARRQSGTPEPGGVARTQGFNDPYFPYHPALGIAIANSEGVAGNFTTYPYRVHCLQACSPTYPSPAQQTLGSPGNQVRLVFVQQAGITTATGGGVVYMGSSFIFLTEATPPRVTFTGAPPATTWTKNPFTLTANINDYGLGPRDAIMTAPGVPTINAVGQSGACTSAGTNPQGNGTGTQNQGDRNHRCGALSMNANSSSLPDGSYEVTVFATDILNNALPGGAQLPIKLDRTPPRIALSGTLHDARDGFVNADRDLTLSAVATDGALTPDTARRSGVVSLTATLDGRPLTGGTASAPCTRPEGSCSLSISPKLTAPQIAALDETSQHTLAVTATDALGQSHTESVRFRVDLTEPEVYVAGTLFEGDQATLSDPSYSVDPLGADEAPDGAEGARTAGIRSIEFLIDGERVDLVDFGCRTDCKREAGRNTPYTLDTASRGDGDHEFDVLVTDAAGNVGSSDAGATFAGVTPLAPDRVSLPDETTMRYDGGAAGDRAGESVANVGDVNGDGLEDTLVGAPGHDPGGRPGAGAAWLVLGSETGGNRVLRAGEPGVIRFAGATAADATGTSVAAGGDVNGDGYADMLVGAPGPVLGGVSVRGTVYVVFGRPDPQSINLNTLGAQGMTIRGPVVNLPLPDLIAPPTPKTFGSSLATRRLGDFSVDGDVNGDGLDDIVVGAADQDAIVSLLDVRLDAGIVYVVFGRATGGTIDAASLGSGGYRIIGAAGLNRAGQAVALPGDVNGDDRADIAVVAPNASASAARADSGIAYVAYGKAGTADVDLRTLGGGGIRVLGAAGDRLRTAAGPGDIDSDSTPDLLLGGRDATAIFLQPGSDVDLAAPSFAGYRMLAPSPTAGSATVSAAGDLDGDDGPDQLVSFPTQGSGTVYAVRGKHDTSPVSLATLPGNRGTSLEGTPGARVFGAIDALDAGPGGAPILRSGSPTASPSGTSSGSVSASASVTKVNRTRNGCQVSALWAFPYLARNPGVLPRCRYARNRTVDVPAFSVTNPRARFNPRPTCGATSPSCRPGALAGGNARLEVGIKTRSQLELVDSFGTPMVKLVKRTVPGVRLCFDVFDARTPTLKAGSTCDTADPNAPGPGAQVVIVGKQCMATDSLENDHWLMRIMGIKKKVPGSPKPTRQAVLFEELQGFVKRDDITRLPSARNGFSSRERALGAYTGCGVPRKRRSPNSGTTTTIPPAAFGFEDRYVSNDSYMQSELARPPALGAGNYGAYSNYQVPVLQAPDLKRPPEAGESFTAGADWAALATSSTAVSGAGYGGQRPPGQERNRQTGPGGLVRAIVPRGRPFLEYDRMSYSDPNVRCVSNEPPPTPPWPRVATWIYGAANPSGERNHKMIGWIVVRRPEPGDRILRPGTPPTCNP